MGGSKGWTHWAVGGGGRAPEPAFPGAVPTERARPKALLQPEDCAEKRISGAPFASLRRIPCSGPACAAAAATALPRLPPGG